jgi:hypothetical protein
VNTNGSAGGPAVAAIAPPPTVNIVGHVERLGPEYETGWVYFSLNVTAALATDEITADDVRSLLSPWTWQWDTLAVLGVDAADKTVKLPNGVEILLGQAPPGSPELVAALQREREAVIASDASLAPFKTDLNAPSERKTIDAKERNWKGFLAHVSTFAAPLPQGLNLKLCVLFRVKEDALVGPGVQEIVAVPIFNGGPFGARGPRLPGDIPWDVTQNYPLRRIAGSPTHYVWDYEGGANPITASLNPCPVKLEATSAQSFLDFESLWVRKAGPLLPEDWTVRLESVLADAFDMPRRLLDALQANIQDVRDKKPGWTVDDTFHDAFFASLRDLANCGLGVPPESRTLAATLIDGLTGASAVVQAITDWETDHRKVLRDWTDRVASFLGEVDPNFSLPTKAPSSTDIEVCAPYARELEHIYAVFASEDNLRRFFLAEWEGALGETDFWKQNRGDVIKRLEDVQLRKRLAIGNVGVAWTGLNGDLHEEASLVSALKQGLADYVTARFASPPSKGYKDYLPWTTSPPSAVIPHLQSYVDSFVRQAVLPREGDATDPGSVREDLVVQVDRLQREAGDGTSADQADFLRRLAGVGILLRRQGASGTGWHCLNMAKLEILAQTLVMDPVPVPIRLGYRNGLRTSYLAYANQPMAAKSPSADLSHNNALVAPGEDVPLLEYENPYSDKAGIWLEGLTYGETYDAAVFLMGNAGNLPEALAVGDALGKNKIPWKFQLPPAAWPPDGLPGQPAQPPLIQSITYKRRVPVGHVRLGSPDSGPGETKQTDRLPLPTVPATVLPLTRSLHAVNVDEQHNDREEALVLLTPKGDHWPPGRDVFLFNVRPPSAPLEVWDRWVSKDGSEVTRKKRVNVWARYHERADVPQVGAAKESVPDLSIDDPAVEAIEFCFSQLYPEPETKPPIRVPFLQPPPTDSCSKNLSCVQKAPVRVEIRASDTLLIPTNQTSPVKIDIPPGQIWKIEIRPVIADRARFQRQDTDTGQPVTLFVEVADRLFVDATLADVRARLNMGLETGKGELDASLSLEGSTDRFRDRIHRVELLVQRWRWDGRPLSYFEASGVADPFVRYRFPFDRLDQLEEYDGSLFRSRESSDHLVVPGHVDFADPKTALAVHLFRPDLSTLPGALYFRLAIRVFSRYEGLMLKDDSIDSRPPDSAGVAEQWKRLVVPCRWSKTVPRPVVKLVLPLTLAGPALLLSADPTPLAEGSGNEDTGDPPAAAATGDEDAASATPGLLVVLDEAWYSDALGGVAEVFEWDIARAALPDVPGDSRLQFGPDPILDLTEDPLVGSAVNAHQAIGAIGYTQDTGTAAPLFTCASFVVPPPIVDGIPDLSWWFLKLRFRRRLDGVTARSAAESLWTDPVWCQLLPASNRLRVDANAADHSSAKPAFVTTSSIGVSAKDGALVDRQTRKVIVPQTSSVEKGGHALFTWWALVTRQVVDALGRTSQEAFDSLVFVEKGRVPLPPSKTALRVRLVEVQQHGPDPINEAEKLYAALFPPPPDSDATEPSDAKARIVRVTPPLELLP